MTETETEIRIESGTVPAGQTEVTFGVDLSRGVSPSGWQQNDSALRDIVNDTLTQIPGHHFGQETPPM